MAPHYQKLRRTQEVRCLTTKTLRLRESLSQAFHECQVTPSLQNTFPSNINHLPQNDSGIFKTFIQTQSTIRALDSLKQVTDRCDRHDSRDEREGLRRPVSWCLRRATCPVPAAPAGPSVGLAQRGHTGPTRAPCGGAAARTEPELTAGHQRPHPRHPPDARAHGLVQRLAGQPVLGDGHQQRLPVEHRPGGGAGRPGPPLPEVDGEQETLRAVRVRGGAADLVPVSITQGDRFRSTSLGAAQMQLPDGPDYGYWDGAQFSTKGRKTIFETILEAAPKEGHCQRSADPRGRGPGPLRPSFPQPRPGALCPFGWDSAQMVAAVRAITPDTRAHRARATKLTLCHRGVLLLKGHSQCPVL